MASRKKAEAPSKAAKPRSASEAVRQFTVVLEEIRSQNRAFGEGQQLLREQMQAGFERVDRRFEQVDRRFEQVDRRFEQVDRRFEQIDRRFEQIDGHLEQVDGRLGRLEDAVLENRREIKLLRADVNDLAAKKADREEVEALVARAVGRTGSH